MDGLAIMITIIAINIGYVSLFTLRLMLTIKSQLTLASILSMFEVLIYLMGLNLVLQNIDKPLNLLAYCLGWGSGVWLGNKIEGWLALGYVTMQIVVDRAESSLPTILREKGFGVTSWLADGRDGPRLVMQVLAKRNNEKKLMRTVQELAPKAFVISHEPRFFHGGFWIKSLK